MIHNFILTNNINNIIQSLICINHISFSQMAADREGSAPKSETASEESQEKKEEKN